MDNRKLGWIAIGIGIVALLVAFGGRGRPAGWYNDGPRFGQGPRAVAPAAPQAPQGVAPQAPQAPGPQQWVQPQGPQHWGGPRARFDGPAGWGGPHGGFFLFRLFGGLLRTVLFLLILFLLVRWFWHRRNGQAPPSDQSRPGPEQPPYTGGTQAL